MPGVRGPGFKSYLFASDLRFAGGLPLPRLGPPRHQQRLRVEGRVPVGHPLLHVDDGAPPLRPVRHDPQLRGQQHLSGS